jgi:5-methyltetrahydropteroyltriglutamate--homocysteine methyltransferase
MSHGGNPPFRAEHVGSLLRPNSLLEARNKLERMEITVEQLREIEDRAIRTAVKRQEEIGLPAVTDGEFRRGSWHMDFLCRIGGVAPGGTQLSASVSGQNGLSNVCFTPKSGHH